MRLVEFGGVAAVVALALALPHGSAQDPLDACLHVDAVGQAYVTRSGTVYVESNGIPSLQRGGVTLLGEAETCDPHWYPDASIF